MARVASLAMEKNSDVFPLLLQPQTGGFHFTVFLSVWPQFAQALLRIQFAINPIRLSLGGDRAGDPGANEIVVQIRRWLNR